jgi:hypothetical protein
VDLPTQQLYSVIHTHTLIHTYTHIYTHIGDVDLPTQQLYSVIVENVPRAYRSSRKLGELFEELLPGTLLLLQID